MPIAETNDCISEGLQPCVRFFRGKDELDAAGNFRSFPSHRRLCQRRLDLPTEPRLPIDYVNKIICPQHFPLANMTQSPFHHGARYIVRREREPSVVL